MNKLKGVAIGAGYFSQFHFDAWNRMDDISLVAICDRDETRARDVSADYGVASHYSDFEQMLATEKPDFVDIITRPDSHLELTEMAVRAGVPVICQKPLAPSYEEAVRLVEVAASAEVPFMVHENFRFQPWYREIKSLLDQQAIGDRLHGINIRTRTGDGWPADAYLGRQPYFREMERFLVFEMGVHFVDTMRYLAGEVDGVYASLRQLNPDIAGEDAGMVLFEFEGGAEGVWDANRFNETNAEDPRFTFAEAIVEGNGGTIRLHSDGRMYLKRLGQPESEHEYSCPKRNFAGDCVYETQRHFVECLRQSVPFETGGDSYLKTLAIQEAIYESAETQQPVRGLVARTEARKSASP